MAGYFSKTDFTPSTSNTYTVSFWVKINNFAPTTTNVPYLWSISDSDSSGLFFQGDTTPHNITFYRNNGNTRFSPTVYMRDVNAWWHIHLKVSSGTGTLYYNGESVKTSITVDAQNYNGGGAEHYIHTYGGGLSSYDNLECVMSHFHFVDGTAYDPTAFGETDSTTREWKIKTNPSVNYGTNGYFILKDGNTGTDYSGNGNNFTLTGTCTKTEDCPSNVFATYNPLSNTGVTLTQGNLTGTYSTNDANIRSTLGVSTGKWYWETKFTTGTGAVVGICNEDVTQATNRAGSTGFYGVQNASTTYAYYRQNGSSGQTSGYPNPVQGNIVNVALDLDNSKMYIGINGVYKNQAGTTSDIANGTNPFFSGIASSVWFPILEYRGGGTTTDSNFGNGYFGTTAVSSAGTNASGIGIFEYDVPAGYTALSTKGLNE